MLVQFSLFLIVMTAVAHGHNNIHEYRSPGGSGWQGSNFAAPSIADARSSSSWGDPSTFSRSNGGWQDSNGIASFRSYSNGYNSNGYGTGKSGCGSDRLDDSNVGFRSAW